MNTKNGEASISPLPDQGVYGGMSYSYGVCGNEERVFDKLNTLKEDQIYEYALSITEVEGRRNRPEWSGTVKLKVNAVAGNAGNLHMLASRIVTNWDAMVGKGVTNIGQPETLELVVPFRDTAAPQFTAGHPTFQPGDSVVKETRW